MRFITISADQGVLTLNHIDDEREVQECPEHDVELVEAGEDAPKPFEPSEEALDVVAPLVEVSVIGPRRDAVGLWRDDGRKAEVECELPGSRRLHIRDP